MDRPPTVNRPTASRSINPGTVLPRIRGTAADMVNSQQVIREQTGQLRLQAMVSK